MASCSSLLAEEKFQCAVCLEVFNEPVYIPCGHIFCMACITRYWDSTEVCQCPLCQIVFNRRPDLFVNPVISEMAAKITKSVEVKAEPGDVACDVCTGAKLKALRSCLECLTSFCEAHLQHHQNVVGLKRHTLIDPVENLEDRMCMKHDKLLELFCQIDQTCVCQFCMVTDHKNHPTVPLEKEYGVRKDQLAKVMLKVQQMILERQQKVLEVKQSVELSKSVTEKDVGEREAIFTALVCSVERSHTDYIEVVEEKQKTVERLADGLIQELDQEINELERRCTALNQLIHTEDQLHLLQSFPSLDSTTLGPTRDWSKVSAHGVLSGEDVRKSLRGYVSHMETTVKKVFSELMENFNKEMVKRTDAKLKWMQQYAVDVTLDPESANPSLIVSEDGKQFRDGDRKQKVPHNPKRIHSSLSVMGKEGFSSGRFYFEVKGSSGWMLGVARESIDRKTTEHSFWVIGLCDESYRSFTSSPSVHLPLKLSLHKVGVFVDYEEGLVSFYNVEARSQVYSFSGQTITEKLYPYFTSCGNDTSKNSAPVILSPVTHSDSTHTRFKFRFW
ncbi:E3 ubiquitin-protein ligase TRIM39-like [Esox lucius]|uniref:Uncharacterized protein n=1 Tax=Esox lucius TaxID=8010 RepID=A0A3P9A8T4_ESOLU|nr:E3 ubiquitin-protein ligase TRIM39-like [Esox lucius]